MYAGRPQNLFPSASMNPVMNGVTFAFFPSASIFTFTTSKPKSFVRFHEPLRATKMVSLYEAGNMRVEDHAEHGGVRAQQRDGRRDAFAWILLLELRVGDAIGVAVGE